MYVKIALSLVIYAVVDCILGAHSLVREITLYEVPHYLVRKFIGHPVRQGVFKQACQLCLCVLLHLFHAVP